MITGEFLEHFPEAERRAANRWLAPCPRHREVNLEIVELPDRITIACPSGCSEESITETIGLKLSDLFFKPNAKLAVADSQKDANARKIQENQEFYAALREFQERPAQPGSPFYQPDSETAEATIDGEALVRDTESFICKYVVLPSAARLPLALWAIATHIFDSFDAFPYLCLTSPAPRCGKTRVLELLELLCARPWRGTAPTEAAIFRFVESHQPTLLLDEVESLASRKKSERDSAVLAILNAGYRAGQLVPRCVGNSHELQNFKVYCPKAFAAIGTLPPTLADRSIIVPMQRRAKSEPVSRFKFVRAKEEVKPLVALIKLAAKTFAAEIKATYTDLPELPFLTDRDDEIFSPLFAVCAVLCPVRLKELEASAKALCDAKAVGAADDSLPLQALHHIFELWPEGQNSWLGREALAALKTKDDSPWQGDVELSSRKLARWMRGFGVNVRQVRTPSGNGKGYVFDELKRAISSYPVLENETCETTRVNTE